MDANQTAVEPDIGLLKMLLYKCNSGVSIKPGTVACGIVNNIQPFWNFQIVNMLLYKAKSLNLNLNFIAFSMNQVIECLL